VALLALVAVGEAHADPAPRARLVYKRQPGAEGCPDESAVRAAVSTRLGYDPFVETATLTVSVFIDRDPRGLHAQIDLLDEAADNGGSRQLSSKRRDCRDLAPAIALAISIAIDPLRAMQPATDTSSRSAADVTTRAPTSDEIPVEKDPMAPTPTQPEPEPVPVPIPVLAPTPTPTPPPPAPVAAVHKKPLPPAKPPLKMARERFTWVGAGILGSFFSAPSPTVGFVVESGLARHNYAFTFEGRAEYPSTLEVANSAGQINVTSLLVSIIPCYRRPAIISLDLCGIMSGGFQVSTARGFAVSNDSATTGLFDLGTRVGLEYALSHIFTLALHADGRVPLLTTVLHADGAEVYRTSRLQAAIGLSLLGFFP
jgi:hypothetical protein